MPQGISRHLVCEDDFLWKEVDADESSWELDKARLGCPVCGFQFQLQKDSSGKRCIVISLMKKSKPGAHRVSKTVRFWRRCVQSFSCFRWDRWEYLVKCEDVPPDTTVTNKAKLKNASDPVCVNRVEVFFDISLDGTKLGRIVMGLYGKQASCRLHALVACLPGFRCRRQRLPEPGKHQAVPSLGSPALLIIAA